MPRSKSRDRKTTNDQNASRLSSRSPGILQLELENLALKAKNVELAKGHVKLTLENQELKNELMDVKAQFLKMQTKYNNVATGLGKLENELKKCTPSILEILNLILQANKDINGNKPTKAKNATVHTVKPHIVNGTVLNLNPTITLNRMSNNEAEPRASTSQALFTHESFNNDETFNNESPDNLSINNENIDPSPFTPRDRNAAVVPMEEDNNEEDAAEMNEEEDQSLNCLSTIPEETSMERSSISIGEIRICLKRLSHQEISRLSKNDASEMNVNDTCFNIEATIIEDSEARCRKTVSADISFSPNGNSTHISNNDCALSANSRVVSRRKYTGPSNGAATSTFCENETTTPNSFLNLPTPSLAGIPTPFMSCLGDIGDKNDGSKLEILQESKSSGSSPTVKKELPVVQDSPRSSKSAGAGVNRRRRGASEADISMSPRVLLERADTRSSELAHQEEDDVKENNQVVAKTKKSEPKKKVKRSVPSKRSKKSETLKEPQKSEKTSKITKELHVKLSNFIPESSPRRSSTASIQSDYGEGRPKRAARPGILKDASLKTKMRRLI